MLKVYQYFAFVIAMLDHADIPRCPALLRPLAEAAAALGHLAHALEVTPFHQAWLWREMARSSAKSSQLSGHRVRLDRLMLVLAGVPLEPADDDSGLAAARRLFLMVAPLFRETGKVDSLRGLEELFEPLWPGAESGRADDRSNISESEHAVGDLKRLVSDLVRRTDVDDRPLLLDLLIRLHRQGRMQRAHRRFALPLAIQHAGILPRAAPGLLGGRLSFSNEGDDRITLWLVRALEELSKEASAAAGRLAELSRRHAAWQRCLSEAGLRGHSRLPAVLGLLAVTPVLSASLVARHLDCSPQGAGAMLRQLEELGIVIRALSRVRWKIYLAADLALPGHGHAMVAGAPLSFSEPMPVFDREATERLLDDLLLDLERLERRTQMTLEAGS